MWGAAAAAAAAVQLRARVVSGSGTSYFSSFWPKRAAPGNVRSTSVMYNRDATSMRTYVCCLRSYEPRFVGLGKMHLVGVTSGTQAQSICVLGGLNVSVPFNRVNGWWY